MAAINYTQTLLKLRVGAFDPTATAQAEPWRDMDAPSAIQLFVQFLVCIQEHRDAAQYAPAGCSAMANQRPNLFRYDSWRTPHVRTTALRILQVFLNRTESIDTVTLHDFLHAVLTEPVTRDGGGSIPQITTWNNVPWSWFVYRDTLWFSVLNHYTLSSAEETRLAELTAPLDGGIIPPHSANAVPSFGPFGQPVLAMRNRTNLQQQWMQLVNLLWQIIPSANKGNNDDAHALVRQMLEAFLFDVYNQHYRAPPVDTISGVESLLHSTVGYFAY